MNAPQPIDLDSTDERIVELLREDGRMPYRTLARELDLTEATVRARVRRLEDSNVMRVVAVTDFEAVGYEFMLAVGVQVEHRSPEDVALELAGFAEVFSINVVIGTYDLELLVVAENQAALTELIYERLASLPGVRRLVPSIAVNVLKNQPDWVPFYTPAESSSSKPAEGSSSKPAEGSSSKPAEGSSSKPAEGSS
jgi:Lrp/AsnC family transcriptional regulator for asnA, asnC and gidA